MVMFKQDNSQSPLMQQALALMSRPRRITNVGEGIGSAASSIAGALMQKKGMEQEAVKQAEMAKALQGAFAPAMEGPQAKFPREKSSDEIVQAMLGNADLAPMAANMQLASLDRKQAMADQLAAQPKFDIVQDPYGRGGAAQKNSITGELVNYQGPEKPLEPKLPPGMQMVDGTPQWIPGYIEGQAQVFAAKSAAGQDNWQPDPSNPAIQVNLTTGERKLTPQTPQEKSDIKAASLDAQNQSLFETFDIGMKNIEEAMSQTETGPVVGRLPTFTAAQQTAEGATATMAPILKSMFRTAGEGTFTDKDQELLLNMVPARTDHPEARKAKISMIYDIVRAKLGVAGDVKNGGKNSIVPANGQGDNPGNDAVEAWKRSNPFPTD